jgi:hypothetical protein
MMGYELTYYDTTSGRVSIDFESTWHYFDGLGLMPCSFMCFFHPCYNAADDLMVDTKPSGKGSVRDGVAFKQENHYR